MGILSFCRTLTHRASTIEERRALFRSDMLPARYSGRLHVASTVVVCSAFASAAWLAVESWGAVELWTVLVALFVATSTVYFSHRFPMHRNSRRLTAAYDLHTRCHHMLFNEEHSEIRSAQDVYMVMFPPTYVLAFCVVGIPLLALPAAAVSWDAALAFAGVAYTYFLAYELVHLASHVRRDSWLHRVPVLGYLLRHHRRHHAWDVMHHGNFSMLNPMWDWVLGTKLSASSVDGSDG